MNETVSGWSVRAHGARGLLTASSYSLCVRARGCDVLVVAVTTHHLQPNQLLLLPRGDGLRAEWGE